MLSTKYIACINKIYNSTYFMQILVIIFFRKKYLFFLMRWHTKHEEV